MDPQYFPLVSGGLSFLGALAGVLVGIPLKSWLDVRAERERRSYESRFHYKDERAQAYLEFLDATTKWSEFNSAGFMNSIAPHEYPDPLGGIEPIKQIERIEALLQRLGRAYDTVKLFASAPVIEAADAYRQGVQVPTVPPSGAPSGAYSVALSNYLSMNQPLREAFNEAIRQELETMR